MVHLRVKCIRLQGQTLKPRACKLSKSLPPKKWLVSSSICKIHRHTSASRILDSHESKFVLPMNLPRKAGPHLQPHNDLWRVTHPKHNTKIMPKFHPWLQAQQERGGNHPCQNCALEAIFELKHQKQNPKSPELRRDHHCCFLLSLPICPSLQPPSSVIPSFLFLPSQHLLVLKGQATAHHSAHTHPVPNSPD